MWVTRASTWTSTLLPPDLRYDSERNLNDILRGVSRCQRRELRTGIWKFRKNINFRVFFCSSESLAPTPKINAVICFCINIARTRYQHHQLNKRLPTGGIWWEWHSPSMTTSRVQVEKREVSWHARVVLAWAIRWIGIGFTFGCQVGRRSLVVSCWSKMPAKLWLESRR